MPLFKMESIYGGSPQMCVLAGSVTVTPTGSQPANTVVSQSYLAPAANAVGAALGPTSTLNPMAPRVIAVVNPTTAYRPQVASNATNANVLMLDLSGYPGNILSVTLNTKPAAAATPGTISVLGTTGVVFDIDNVNKLVYCGIYNFATSGLLNWQNGMTLYYNIVLSDSFVP